MAKRLIALIEMADEEDSFYVDNVPKWATVNVPKFIKGVVNDPSEVDYVEIVEVVCTNSHWSNPSCNPEKPFT